MATICFSSPILMKFYILIKYIKISKSGCIILTNNKNWQIVGIAGIRYICPTRLVLTYIQRAAIRNLCAKFHQESFQTERLVRVARDGTADSASLITFLMLIQNIFTL